MGLITTYGDANKVTDELLNLSYTSVIVASGEETTIRRFVRLATKRYSYVGMDMSTAASCVAAKTAQYTYTRAVYRLKGETITDETEKALGAAVNAVRESANMWRVEIAVNIQDEAITDKNPTDPSGLFTSIDFDED